MKKEDLKAGYVLVFEGGHKEIVVPKMYFGDEVLALFTSVNATGCQQIRDYDPFEKENIIEVWGLAIKPEETMTTSLNSRKLLWKKEPIKVTGDELTVLRNLPSTYTYIARDEDGRLFVYDGNPYLHGNTMYVGNLNRNVKDITKLTFDVIKPLTCHKISDLL